MRGETTSGPTRAQEQRAPPAPSEMRSIDAHHALTHSAALTFSLLVTTAPGCARAMARVRVCA